MRAAVILPLALLAACGQAPEPPAPSPAATPSASPSPALPAPASLVGEYRVAAIDGKDLDEPFGIALSITASRVSFEPTCGGWMWSYAYADGRLDIERRQEQLHRPLDKACEVVRPPDAHLRLANALDAVNRAGVTPSNGIELSGNGRSVLLFTQ